MSLFGSDSRDKAVEELRELSQTDNATFQKAFQHECSQFFIDTHTPTESTKHEDAMYGFLYNGADPLQEYGKTGHSVFAESVNAVSNRVVVKQYTADEINSKLDMLREMVFADKFDLKQCSTEDLAKLITSMWMVDKYAPRITNPSGQSVYQGQAVDIVNGLISSAHRQGRIVPLYDSNSNSQERNEWVQQRMDEAVSPHASHLKMPKVTDKVVTDKVATELLSKTDKVVDKSVKSPIGVKLTRKGGNEP